MKASLLLSLLPVAQAAVIDTRQSKTGDGKQGDTDATQGDLSQRPPPRFPFPITKFPVAKETVVLKNAKYIMPGEVFDGKMKRYERPEGSCNEQAEGTDADAVFNLLPGSTIRNVIIGKNQAEGIHALGDAWVENDALTSKGLNTQLRVIGGGARSATDKYNITGFYAEGFGTFYQSCGNCLNQAKRNATIQNVIAVDGLRMGINAQIDNVTSIVDKEIGNNVQTVPYYIGNGPDEKYALYNETRDNITKFKGKVTNAYEPEDPYEWLEEFWPEGFN
uniref:Pectate lyase n=1 Tax=Fusarium oxysporum (strain Fo5176) TaxID=660025 RepID=A0A0D2Y632_FUSOF